MGKKVRISDESVNCYGTRIITSGIDLSYYKEVNPVLLFMHDRSKGVVGVVKNLEVKGTELIGELEFDKASPLSEQLEKQYEFGSMRMVSASFRILETSSDKSLLAEGQTRETVTRCQLFEVSCVDIGGNANAIVLSDQEGNTLPLSSDGGEGTLLPLLNSESSNNPINKVNEMETKELALSMGLAETATEAEITAKIKEMKLAADNAAAVQKSVDNLVLKAVETAISEKRLNAAMKDHFVELGKKVGLETLLLTLGAMQPQGKVTAVVNHSGGRQHRVVSGDKYQKLSEVPADDMLELRENHRDEYIRLYKAEFGFEPKDLD